MNIQKNELLALLEKFTHQRAGLNPADYGIYPGSRDIVEARRSYMRESRRIQQQGRDAKTLLRYVENSKITAEELRSAFRAFSGRLSLVETDKGYRLDYCTGQYFPTEYRSAVCAVLASAIWDYHRPDYQNDDSPGDSLRKVFVRLFGRSLARRWFDA